jgi:ABC-2 type transport system permease protein
MDAPAAKPVRINYLLPYYAVLFADIRGTLRSWIYRLWAFLSIASVSGWLLYGFGAHRVGHIQPAPELLNDLFTWIIWGSVTLIILLTASTICGERGNLADSVLSRGISRSSYYLGKWHARLLVVLTTFLFLAGGAITAATMLLDGSALSVYGCLVAVGVVAALLVMIVSCGVMVSALANSPMVAITVVWMALYGIGFLLSFLPTQYPSPDRAIRALPMVLKGTYDLHTILRIAAGAMSTSLLMAVVGMVGFSRKDV